MNKADIERKGTLVIGNVDFTLLETQRLALAATIIEGEISDNDIDVLSGLLSMLDEWSDREPYQ